jgi:transketolase
MVSKSIEAAEKLQAEGIAVQVLNVSTLKPLLKEEVLKFARGKKAVITAEESVKTGGLGGAIASLLFGELNAAFAPAFAAVAIDDQFGVSAHSYEELLVKFGLSSADVYNAVKTALKKSQL